MSKYLPRLVFMIHFLCAARYQKRLTIKFCRNAHIITQEEIARNNYRTVYNYNFQEKRSHTQSLKKYLTYDKMSNVNNYNLLWADALV